MFGIIASSWRKIVAYVTDAVTFDGSNDYLDRAAGLTWTNTKQCTLSVWCRNTSFAGNDYIFQTNDGGQVNTLVTIDTTRWQFQVENSAGTQILRIDSNALPPSANAWFHILISYDLANTTAKMYVNGTDVTNIITGPTNDDAIWSDQIRIGNIVGGSNYWIGDMAEFYMTDEYLDLSVQANREKFILSSVPVNLGSDGSTPTGTPPRVYLAGNASVWNAGTNQGSGGDFVMTGAVTDSANEPVELP